MHTRTGRCNARRTQREVAAELGITPPRVGQIEAAALEKVAARLRALGWSEADAAFAWAVLYRIGSDTPVHAGEDGRTMRGRWQGTYARPQRAPVAPPPPAARDARAGTLAAFVARLAA